MGHDLAPWHIHDLSNQITEFNFKETCGNNYSDILPGFRSNPY